MISRSRETPPRVAIAIAAPVALRARSAQIRNSVVVNAIPRRLELLELSAYKVASGTAICAFRIQASIGIPALRASRSRNTKRQKADQTRSLSSVRFSVGGERMTLRWLPCDKGYYRQLVFRGT